MKRVRPPCSIEEGNRSLPALFPPPLPLPPRRLPSSDDFLHARRITHGRLRLSCSPPLNQVFSLMKIAFDGTVLHGRKSGVGYYCEELLKAILLTDHADEF